MLEEGDKIYIDYMKQIFTVAFVREIEFSLPVTAQIYCISSDDKVYKFSLHEDGKLERN